MAHGQLSNAGLTSNTGVTHMWIRVNHGIIAKKRPEDGIEVEFTPLVANDYLSQIHQSGYIEITKTNGEPAFLSAEKFSELLKTDELVIIEK